VRPFPVCAASRAILPVLWRHPEISAAPIRDGKGRAVLAVCTFADVSARKAADAALAESETRLHLALEAGRMGTWSWDLRTDRL
jgi:PAS domain-containing protein